MLTFRIICAIICYMKIIPKNENKVTLHFEDSVEASMSRRAIAPHLGKFARVGFALARARSIAADVVSDKNHPLEVSVPNEKLPDIAQDSHHSRAKAEARANGNDLFFGATLAEMDVRGIDSTTRAVRDYLADDHGLAIRIFENQDDMLTEYLSEDPNTPHQ